MSVTVIKSRDGQTVVTQRRAVGLAGPSWRMRWDTGKVEERHKGATRWHRCEWNEVPEDVQACFWRHPEHGEYLLYANGVFHIVHKGDFGQGRMAWAGRDGAWICDIGEETTVTPLTLVAELSPMMLAPT